MQCKKEGCNAKATASGYCFFHDPKLKEKHKEAAAKGGRGGVDILDLQLKSIKDLRKLLQETINNVRKNKNYSSRARVIGQLVSILQQVIMNEDLEKRVFELEKTLLTAEKRCDKNEQRLEKQAGSAI